MEEVFNQTPTIGDRIEQDGNIDSSGTFIPNLCYFFNNYGKYGNGAIYFEIWSYIPGSVPAGYIPDPKATNATFDISHFLDPKGNPKEVIHISHVLLFGEVAVIEATKGTGGSGLVERYLNKIFKKYCKPRPPRVAFTVAMSTDLEREIEQGGGAVGFSLGITSPIATQNPIAGLLSSASSKLQSSDAVMLTWTAKGQSKLDVTEVVNEARAAHNDHFDDIVIKLKHGSIRGLSKYRMQDKAEVDDLGGKNPDHAQLRDLMTHYLNKLMTPDSSGKRTIDASGKLV